MTQVESGCSQALGLVGTGYGHCITLNIALLVLLLDAHLIHCLLPLALHHHHDHDNFECSTSSRLAGCTALPLHHDNFECGTSTTRLVLVAGCTGTGHGHCITLKVLVLLVVDSPDRMHRRPVDSDSESRTRTRRVLRQSLAR